MANSTLYTILDRNGAAEERGLTAIEAMNRILTYDGYAYEIRPMSDGGFRLFHSDGSANSTRSARHMVATIAFSLADNEQAAREEIALKVIRANWPRLPEAITDAAYDEMRADS